MCKKAKAPIKKIKNRKAPNKSAGIEEETNRNSQ